MSLATTGLTVRSKARGSSTVRRASHWTRMNERGSYLGMRLLVTLYRYGGNWLLAPALRLVVLYFFVTRANTRRYSRLYLRRALGREPRLWDVWRHHLAFGRALMARVSAWMGRLPREAVDFPARDAMWALREQGQGVIFLGAHVGNLDMCRTIVQPGRSYRLNIVVHTRNAEKFNRLLRQLNPETQINLVQVEQITPETAILLRNRLDEGEAVVLLADRVPSGTEARHFTADFLGDPALFPLGPFRLALLLEAPVFFMASVETARGYRIVMQPLHREPRKMKRAERETVERRLFRDYVGQLEQLCRQWPLQWFNYYDFWLDDVRQPQHGSKSRK